MADSCFNELTAGFKITGICSLCELGRSTTALPSKKNLAGEVCARGPPPGDASSLAALLPGWDEFPLAALPQALLGEVLSTPL